MTTTRVIYLGLSTQKNAVQVGGWSNIDQMGLKVALTYDTKTKKQHSYTESEISSLIDNLQTSDLIVGFNQLRFDYKVLSAYTDIDLSKLPNFDMLSKIESTLRFRVSREDLAKYTLDEAIDNRNSLTLEKKVDINKRLFAHGCKERHLYFRDTKEKCDTSTWADTARSITGKEPPRDPIVVASKPAPTHKPYSEPKPTTTSNPKLSQVSEATEQTRTQSEQGKSHLTVEKHQPLHQVNTTSTPRNLSPSSLTQTHSATTVSSKPDDAFRRTSQIQPQKTTTVPSKPAPTASLHKEEAIATASARPVSKPLQKIRQPNIGNRLTGLEYLRAKYLGPEYLNGLSPEYLNGLSKGNLIEVQMPEEALRIYTQAMGNGHLSPAWYTYKEVSNKLPPDISFQEFNIWIASKWSAPNLYKRKNCRSRGTSISVTYFDRSRTLVSENVGDCIDIRNMKEEEARGI